MAQSDDQRAAARSLAGEGAKAFAEGRWKDCVDLFQRAETLVHAPPHLLYGARAEEKLGHLVKARELYLKIGRDRIGEDAPPAFRRAQAAAAEEVRPLDARIAFVTVTLQGGDASSATVMLDGEPVPAALVGVPRPVDPGEHRIEAKGAAFAAPQQTITLAEGARETVTLVLEAVPAQVANAGAAKTSGDAAPPDGAADGSNSGNGLRIGSYAAFGVGVVGLVTGTVFVLKSNRNRSDSDKLFKDQCAAGCDQSDPAAKQVASLDDSARSAKTLGIVGFAVGGAGLAAGTALFFMSSGHGSAASTAGVRPWVGLGSVGVDGRF